MTEHVDGFVLTPDGFVHGRLTHDGGRIVDIDGQAVTEHDIHHADPTIARIVPGFMDLHVHGGGGADVMDAGSAVVQLAQTHLRHGTTSLLATTMTAPLSDLETALRALAPHCATRPQDGARVLGVHLEGPYINPDKLGAQPSFTAPVNLDELNWLHQIAPIRLITVAPEMERHVELIQQMTAMGFLVQIGHSNGNYEDGVAAMQAGARSFTHLFNAMKGLHHREPGIVGAALAHAHYAEIIPDLLHVHPGAIKVALRAIPGLYAVTDSTAAAGMPDGEYRLGRYRVHKCLGGVRLPDGTLAGSALTMDQAFRNLVGMGLSLAEASLRTAGYPADFLGLNAFGRLRVGARADWVVLNQALRVKAVCVDGENLDLTDVP